jgi:hypothetical protein
MASGIPDVEKLNDRLEPDCRLARLSGRSDSNTSRATNCWRGELRRLPEQLGQDIGGCPADVPPCRRCPIGRARPEEMPHEAVCAVPTRKPMRHVSRLGEAQTEEKFERLGTLRRVLCVGTSMEPTISRGDIVFVGTLKTHANCGIFAIKSNRGEEILVRLDWVPSGGGVLIDSRGGSVERVPVPSGDGNGRRFRLCYDNPLFHSEILPESDIKIIGEYVCRMPETLGYPRPEPVRARR